MKNYDYHSLFYYQILSRIKGLRSGEGERLHDRNRAEPDDPQFDMGYEPRDESYRHNYLRDKHLSTRNVLISGKSHPNAEDLVILANVKRTGESMTIYRKAVEFVFKDKYEDAMKELTELMSKFYEVKVEEASDFSQVDYSDSRYSNQVRVYELR